MNTLLQSAALNQTTITPVFFTVSEKTVTTTGTKSTTGTPPNVADGAFLQMGSTCLPTLKM